MPSPDAPIQPPARIGFVGLGMMGLPMALNLVRAGYQVTGSDLSAQARDAFAAGGGRIGATPQEVAGEADILVTMLPTGAIVREALIGAGGLAAALPRGAVVIDMSSSAPGDTVSLKPELDVHGLSLVDAPVSGGVAKARDGTLAIMVGGEAAAIDRVTPVLDALGGSIIRTGATGSAHAMKALNNFVSAAGLVAVSEALHVGRRFGLAPETIVDALNASTGRNNTTEKKALKFMVPEDYSSGFAMNLMAKDIGIAAALAEDLGMDLDCLTMMSRMWRTASETLGDSADHTAMHDYIGRNVEA